MSNKNNNRNSQDAMKTDDISLDVSTLPHSEEPLSFDEIVVNALHFCKSLPPSCSVYGKQIAELQYRLAGGRLHLAVLGQFNRGKSTFINALLNLNVLPTSILPVTSIPTCIEYDTEPGCTISFFNGNPDLVVRKSSDTISSALKKYVAEENNPKNQLCVQSVKVKCNSPLLANGTVLIDTPGFGSTHVHNTSVTLDLLSGCDAAIFLLSADPPFTQTEVEFLKQVSAYVPKLFFVLNKIDILTDTQLTEVDHFIRSTLVTKLNYSCDTKLFHTSAMKGQTAQKCSIEDPHWKASGLEKINREVLDFLVREKYFALSQALGDKFRDSLCGIEHLLNEQIDRLKAPFEQAISQQKKLSSQIEKLRDAIKENTEKLTTRRQELSDYVEKEIAQGTIRVRHNSDQLITDTLGSAHNLKDTVSQLSMVIPSNLRSSFDKLQYTITDSVNSALREIAATQQREFKNRVLEILPSAPPELTEMIKTDGIPVPSNQDFFTVRPFPLQKLPRLKVLLSANKRAIFTRQLFENPIQEQSQLLSDRLAEDSITLLNTAFDKLNNEFEKRYRALKSHLEKLLQKECDIISDSAEQNAQLQNLVSLIDGLQSLRGMLR